MRRNVHKHSNLSDKSPFKLVRSRFVVDDRRRGWSIDRSTGKASAISDQQVNVRVAADVRGAG